MKNSHGLNILLSVTLLGAGLGPAADLSAAELVLPAPGAMVHLSPAQEPPMLKGIKVNPKDPFRFEFILDKGSMSSTKSQKLSSPNVSIGDPGNVKLKAEANKLIKYFLASLTVPEKDLWVNLSPYEKERIVPDAFGQTQMGRDLLAQDYLLKQLTASLVYPEGDIGKEFWKKVYEQAPSSAGTPTTEPSMLPSRHPSPGGVAEEIRTFPLAAAATQPASAAGVRRQMLTVDMRMFNKVWIVPDKAVVYENVKAGTAYVVESSLKVMTEKDYLAVEKNQSQPGDIHRSPKGEGVCPQAGCQANSGLNTKATEGANPTQSITSKIVREVVIPQLAKEVNTGANFAQLRQVYNALILAVWYKKKIKDSILAQVYADRNKIKGTEYTNSILTRPKLGNKPNDVELIYQRYLEAFKKGAYNYIKEEHDAQTNRVVPRKYFAGGLRLDGVYDHAMFTRTQRIFPNYGGGGGINFVLDVRLESQGHLSPADIVGVPDRFVANISHGRLPFSNLPVVIKTVNRRPKIIPSNVTAEDKKLFLLREIAIIDAIQGAGIDVAQHFPKMIRFGTLSARDIDVLAGKISVQLGDPFMILEKMVGEPFNKKMDALDEPERQIDVFIGLAKTLRKLNKRGVYHLDLGPYEIFVGDDGVFRFVDLETARIPKDFYQDGRVMFKGLVEKDIIKEYEYVKGYIYHFLAEPFWLHDPLNRELGYFIFLVLFYMSRQEDHKIARYVRLFIDSVYLAGNSVRIDDMDEEGNDRLEKAKKMVSWDNVISTLEAIRNGQWNPTDQHYTDSHQADTRYRLELARVNKYYFGRKKEDNDQWLIYPKKEEVSSTGGIDLKSATVDTMSDTKGGSIQFHLDPAILARLKDAQGFNATIVSMEPLGNLRSFLTGSPPLSR